MLGHPAWAKVLNYSWPGNLRELENVLERAFLFAGGTVIDDVELPGVPGTGEEAPDIGSSLKTLRRRAVREAEAEVIVQALKQLQGNVSAVARCMDITPRAVHMRLKRLGIDAAAFRMAVAFSSLLTPGCRGGRRIAHILSGGMRRQNSLIGWSGGQTFTTYRNSWISHCNEL